MSGATSVFTEAELAGQEATELPDRELMAKVKVKKLNVAGLVGVKKLTIKL